MGCLWGFKQRRAWRKDLISSTGYQIVYAIKQGISKTPSTPTTLDLILKTVFICLYDYNFCIIITSTRRWFNVSCLMRSYEVLCSKGFMFRKYLFKRFYVQRVLYSEGPMFRKSYVHKILCSENVCSTGPILRRFYVQKVLYSENPLFYVRTNLHLSVSGKLQCKAKKSQPFILAQISFCMARCRSSSVHNLPKSLLIPEF